MLSARSLLQCGSDTPGGPDFDFPELDIALSRVMDGPDAVIGSKYFQENVCQFIFAFYSTNMPCSAKKLETLDEMSDLALNMLSDVSVDKSWGSSFQMQL